MWFSGTGLQMVTLEYDDEPPPRELPPTVKRPPLNRVFEDLLRQHRPPPTWHAGGKLMADSYRPAQHHFVTKAPLCQVVTDGGAAPPRVRRDVCNTAELSCAPLVLRIRAQRFCVQALGCFAARQARP